MRTLLELPLRDVSASALKDLQSKYPSAMLRVEADDILYNGKMDEEQFWAIISLFNWKTQNSDAILALAVEALSQFSSNDIEIFHDILNEKLYALDGRRFAEQLGSNRYTPDESNYFSVDSFLYARCSVVANGKKFFELVLQNPNKIPKEYTFESLLYLPHLAWEKKTGRDDYEYYPETWSETFSNPNGWPGIVTLKNRITNLL